MFGLMLACAQVSSAAAQDAHRLAASAVDSRISIDGRLDEEAWRTADTAGAFVQLEPDEGAPARFSTRVRVLYGADHVFVGAELADPEPGAVRRTLGRRDEINQADWFVVSFDSYHSRRSAYTFAVNAAGVQFDGIYTGNIEAVELLPGVDPSWDAIWASAVAITERGWSAEIRIPYSMLRFEEAPEQAWGVHFARRVPRIGETSEWPLVPRTERVNLLAGYGTLEGLRGVRPRRNVQVSPYALSGMHVYEDPSRPGSGVNDGQIDVGADLKVGLGTSVTLDAAINPDFGQVESDPAVLNLTAFETLVLEKRPFFVEGTQIFQFLVGPGNLLYTRRVGADAPIIGATKVSGGPDERRSGCWAPRRGTTSSRPGTTASRE